MNVLIIGKGKSGTTVVSKTIQHSLPGSAYHMEPGTVGYFEWLQPCPQGHVVKVIFESWWQRQRLLSGVVRNETSCRFDKVVATVRDPRDVLISTILYRPFDALPEVSGAEVFAPMIQLLRQKQARPDTVPFLEIVDCFHEICPSFKVDHWHRAGGSYLRWLRELDAVPGPVPLHLLRYEDFVAGRLDDLQDYLGVPLSDSRDVGEWQRVKRSATFDNWRRWFTADDISELKPELHALVQEWGYASDWALRQDPTITADESFGYVERVLAEAGQRLAHSTRTGG